ncbi:hypothetical protein SAMN04487910_0811 [Aquimarina amphilecti]|uniref:YhhN-like protein n=1 Tax=Aquimarina amphilecti TaxID=1038014 RepID=A0A1H7I1G8_AQUAM|nr:hypothetical protein SAMN04487910_0811 [Aquimarina amphilecti]
MKNIKLTNILFYLAFSVVIIIAVFFDRKYLAYALPLTIFSIGTMYLCSVKKINFWYILSLVPMIFCDVLIYTDFRINFSVICILTSLYFIFCTVALRKYLLVKAIKRSTFLSVPILISSALVVYLIYSISQLLFDMVKDAIPEVIVCLFSSTMYILVAYLIYMQDTYKDGLKLIIVSCLCIFIVSLLPINELFYFNNIFTVLINIAHVLSLYIFMEFLLNTAPDKIINKSEKYL